jgi:hypothetical protein
VKIKALIHNLPKSAKMALLAVLATKIFVLAVGYLTVYLNSVFSADPLSTVGSMFTHWDANTYLDIAKNGYINSGDQATYIVFFPLYPFLIRLFGFNLESLNFSALIISNVASLIGFFYLSTNLQNSNSTTP